MMKSIILLFLLAVDMFFPKKASAYLDPGTGSYIFQILIAAGLAAIFTLKTFWTSIVVGIRKFFGKSDEDKKDNA